MEKQKTAVEWLEEQWLKLDLEFTGLIDTKEYDKRRNFIIKQAKEMEKEKAIDFARHCLNKAKDLDILTSFMNVEQYYNETFKSK